MRRHSNPAGGRLQNGSASPHGMALRRPPGGPEEQFLYTRVYVNDGGTWLLAANQIARPSEHPRPGGVGH